MEGFDIHFIESIFRKIQSSLTGRIKKYGKEGYNEVDLQKVTQPLTISNKRVEDS